MVGKNNLQLVINANVSFLRGSRVVILCNVYVPGKVCKRIKRYPTIK